MPEFFHSCRQTEKLFIKTREFFKRGTKENPKRMFDLLLERYQNYFEKYQNFLDLFETDAYVNF